MSRTIVQGVLPAAVGHSYRGVVSSHTLSAAVYEGFSEGRAHYGTPAGDRRVGAQVRKDHVLTIGKASGAVGHRLRIGLLRGHGEGEEGEDGQGQEGAHQWV